MVSISKSSNAKLLLLTLLISLLLGCRKTDKPSHPPEESADVVYDWYKFIARVQRPSNPQPVVILNIRNFGFIGVGLYEAVRPGNKEAKSLSSVLYQMPAMPQADNQQYLWSESANAALASMFKSFLAGLTDADRVSIDSMENANYNRFRTTTPEDVLARSQSFGRAIASAIYNWSTTDGFNLSSVGYVPPPVTPGSWVPTPPAFASPVGPFLGNSRPFLASSLTALAPPLPFSFSESAASPFYNAVKEVYDIGKNLTDAQKATANWWGDAGGTAVGLPSPYHALSIITWVQENQQAKLWRAAEVYAKTGIAMKDGPIITFRSKYHYNLIRPITYIQRLIDASWLSYLPNPPYPEYTSGLVGFYAPCIQVLIKEYGDIPVTDNAYDWRGLPARNFTSLSALLNEAAVSRIYGGLHYRFTQEVTIKAGKVLGNEIADIRLLPSKYKHP